MRLKKFPFKIVPKKRLRYRARGNAIGSPTSDVLLQDLFLEQVKKRPDQWAIVTPSFSFTYSEIYTRSNQLGYLLRTLGVQPNTLVAVVMEKGWEQVVGVLGILQAGAAWLPLSPDTPRDQLWHLLENGKVNWVLTQSWLAEQLEWPQSTPCIPVDNYELNEASAMPLEQIQKPADLAYMIYTSESAGIFKGVRTNHQEAVRTIARISRRLGLNHEDRFFSMSPLSSDLWVYAIFGALAVGGTLVMPGPDGLQTPAHWENRINETQATVWCSTPAVLSRFIKFVREQGHFLPGQLRSVLLSGDPIPASLPEQITSFAKNVQVISLGDT